MKSKVLKEESVGNKERKFGAAPKYYPCMLVDHDGSEVPMLFTSNQLKVAMERASKNPEDIEGGKSFWEWLMG